MAEFTLPKNSKVKTGKHFPAKAGAKQVRQFKVYRWSPDDGANPRTDTYDVNRNSVAAHGGKRPRTALLKHAKRDARSCEQSGQKHE